MIWAYYDSCIRCQGSAVFTSYIKILISLVGIIMILLIYSSSFVIFSYLFALKKNFIGYCISILDCFCILDEIKSLTEKMVDLNRFQVCQ